jgi:TonB family protein
MAVVVEPQAAAQAGDAAKPNGQVYRIGKDVSAPVLINEVPAEFPAPARGKKDKFEGTCLIGLVVDASGMPRDVHADRSLGPDFDANAIKAVQGYRFNPGKRAGEAVAVALHVEVNFKRF